MKYEDLQLVTAQITNHFKTLTVNVTQTTDEVLRIGVGLKTKKAWIALVGPNPGGPDASYILENTAISMFIDDGWAYLSGEYPAATTTRISAGAVGTEIIVQVENGTHRVFLLGGTWDSILVKFIDGTEGEKTLTKTRTYVEVKPGEDSLSDPALISGAPADIQEFVEYVESLVQLAGTL